MYGNETTLPMTQNGAQERANRLLTSTTTREETHVRVEVTMYFFNRSSKHFMISDVRAIGLKLLGPEGL